MKIAIITGASSGLGREFARAAFCPQPGFAVYAACFLMGWCCG